MPQPEITRRPRFRAEPPRLNVTGGAFADGARIPRMYTADGENVSPPLTWGEPPAGTKSFALVCDDPDSQSGGFVHWLVWNMKADRRALEENVPKVAEPAEFRQGQNGFGNIGYGGPRPPPGNAHRYVFHLYALDSALDLPMEALPAEVERAIAGHVLGEGRLMGLYQRQHA
jgi:Raf kinase inhibitor-like YbhB/YbcL family protein